MLFFDIIAFVIFIKEKLSHDSRTGLSHILYQSRFGEVSLVQEDTIFLDLKTSNNTCIIDKSDGIDHLHGGAMG